jgi:predicted double-glycine peptidase
MTDLIIAWTILAVSSAGLLLLGRFTAQRTGNRTWPAVVASLLLLLLYAALLRDTPRMVWLVPLQSAVVLGDWLLPLAAWTAGLLLGMPKPVWWRRAVLAAALLVVALIFHVRPFLASIPPTRASRWQDDVCRQSTDSTCSAAAAATLLVAHDIEASEAEMARLCLTNRNGTSFAGLLRGLAIKTDGTPLDAHVLRGDIESLRALDRPVLLHVVLPTGHADSRYAREWGWVPGQPHTVVFFRFDRQGRPVVGDPDVGRERWSVDGLKLLWTGWGLYLAASQKSAS